MKLKNYGDIPDRCPPSSRRHGIMLCQPMEEKRFKKWGSIALIQPKLDGERCRAIIEGTNVTLLSSEENVITSVPHIVDHLRHTYCNPLRPRLELDGELYNHNMDWETISSIVSRTVNLHPDYDQMQLHMFDYVEQGSQIERSQKLGKSFQSEDLKNHPYIKLVPTSPASSIEEVMHWYALLISKGYEGIVLRHPAATYERKRSLYMMKFKPKKADNYEVVGWVQEVDKNGIPKEGRLGSLKLRGSDGTIFGVGSGLTESDRRSLWDDRENLHGRICEVSYQHRTAGGVPRFPIFIKILEKGTTEAETPEGFRFG